MHLEESYVKELGDSGDLCWHSIMKKDISGLGEALTNTFLSWEKILPLTVPGWVMSEMRSKYFQVYPGAITSGAGGGYIIVVSEKEVPGEVRIKVRY